jgi:hypothetical protein
MNLMGKPLLGQKMPKPERGTARAKAHLEAVKQLPCVICLRPGPSDAHHIIHGRYGSRKASDFETIPLCHNHHQGADGIHTNKTLWADRYGFDHEFLPVVADMLAGDWNGGKSCL